MELKNSPFLLLLTFLDFMYPLRWLNVPLVAHVLLVEKLYFILTQKSFSYAMVKKKSYVTMFTMKYI